MAAIVIHKWVPTHGIHFIPRFCPQNPVPGTADRPPRARPVRPRTLEFGLPYYHILLVAYSAIYPRTSSNLLSVSIFMEAVKEWNILQQYVKTVNILCGHFQKQNCFFFLLNQQTDLEHLSNHNFPL